MNGDEKDELTSVDTAGLGLKAKGRGRGVVALVLKKTIITTLFVYLTNSWNIHILLANSLTQRI